jgi:hypothetical protein
MYGAVVETDIGEFASKRTPAGIPEQAVDALAYFSFWRHGNPVRRAMVMALLPSGRALPLAPSFSPLVVPRVDRGFSPSLQNFPAK